MKKQHGLPCFVLLTLLGGPLRADVVLPHTISDNMVLQRDKPVRIWGWAEPGERIKVRFKRKTVRTRANEDRYWSVELPPTAADATPRRLSVKGKNKITLSNILVGEVWLCSGQSNMKWPMHATQHWGEETNDYPEIRMCTMPTVQRAQPATHADATWALCSGKDKSTFSAVAFHFGKTIHEAIDVPIGLIAGAVNGSSIEPWIPLSGFDTDPQLKAAGDEIRARTESYEPHFWSPASFYNGMIAPLAPMSVRGIIWYQGESDAEENRSELYLNKMHALVKGWKTEFKQDDLSFYFVHLAPHTYNADLATLPADTLPRFWDIQLACMRTITNSGMAVITDVAGNTRDWHPRHKRSVGQRLARWALAKNYGQTHVVCNSPSYRSMTIEGDKAMLTFDHVANGLKSRDGKALSAFTMAGADQRFWPAVAVLQGDRIEVSSPYVDAPVAVRFAWHETAIGNLCNSEGLPAIPFRTDDFLPFVSPAFNAPLRDAAICMGPDGIAYMTGTSAGQHTNTGIRVWSSKDLKGWKSHNEVWNIQTSGTWQIQPNTGMRAVRAPELHYINDTFWITYSMNYGGTGLLKSQSSSAEGPYLDVKPDGPITEGGDASLFQDDDGSVYFVYQNGMIARMNEAMNGLAETPHLLKPANADQVGTEGAFLCKIEGRYCLMAVETVESDEGIKTSRCMAALSESLLGPYGDRNVAINHSGQSTLVQDVNGNVWATFSGNDDEATFRDRPGILPVDVGENGWPTLLKQTTLHTRPLVINQTLLPVATEKPGRWRYTFTPPPDDWFNPDYDDSKWHEGEGGFGSLLTHNARIGTIWDSGQIWIRRSFEINEATQGIFHLKVQHDEDAEVHINGVHAADLPWFNGKYELFPISANAAVTLKPGQNTIAIFCNQTAGGQYIDAGLVSTKK